MGWNLSSWWAGGAQSRTQALGFHLAAAHDDDGFYERLEAAKAQLESTDGEARKAIRKILAQEFRRRIDRVILVTTEPLACGSKSAEVSPLLKSTLLWMACGTSMSSIRTARSWPFDRASIGLLEPIKNQAA
jgi:hypothetical protein